MTIAVLHQVLSIVFRLYKFDMHNNILTYNVSVDEFDRPYKPLNSTAAIDI